MFSVSICFWRRAARLSWTDVSDIKLLIVERMVSNQQAIGNTWILAFVKSANQTFPNCLILHRGWPAWITSEFNPFRFLDDSMEQRTPKAKLARVNFRIVAMA
jgi:hypothetical protein